VAGAAPTLSNLCIHLHRNAIPIEQIPTVMNFYQSNTQDFRVAMCVQNDITTSLSASGSLDSTLSSIQGMFAGGFLIFRTTLNGAGLYTYTSLGRGMFDIINSAGHSLLGIPKRADHNRV
jgi:hypothetical protein